MLTRSTFLVKEHVGLFKLANAYDIIDPADGKKIGLAQEKPGAFIHFLRLLIDQQLLPTKIELIENPDDQGKGNVVLSISRGLTLLRAKVKVLLGGTQEIGYFKSKLFSLGGGFYLYDINDRQVAEVKGDWKGWNFRFLDKDGTELGTVTKKWAGLGKELFTSADTYVISMTGSAAKDQGTKALLLAAGLAIDTIYKEK